MLRTSLPLIAFLAGCADQPLDDADPCAAATDVLARCGRPVPESPFGTCQAEQREQAERLVDIYQTDGCDGLFDPKADGLTCKLLPFMCVQHTVDELAPFTSDGCSMFPDGTLADATLWQSCCIEHDVAYYAGGPEAAREAADRALQTCITELTNPGLGDLMYAGVRIGGTPALPTPWRWGYGWTYDPLDGYREVPADQAEAAAASIAAYRAAPLPVAAIEQRLRAFGVAITTVPGLQRLIERVAAAIQQL